MKKLAKLFAILVLTVVSVQSFAQETAIPLCDKIEVVDADLEKKLQLFTEYKDFQQALLYKISDGQYILEIIYKVDEILKVDRKPMSQVELDEFCMQLNDSEKVDKIVNLNQNGRTEFLISSTISGLGFYAWAIPTSLNMTNDRARVGSYMLLGGSSFFVPFLLTKDKDFSQSMARAYSVGTATGVGHGFILRNLMELNNQYPDYDYEKSNRRIAVPILLGLGESLGFLALTKNTICP